MESMLKFNLLVINVIQDRNCHNLRFHDNMLFTCDQCEYKTKLKNHMFLLHVRVQVTCDQYEY